MTTEAAWFVFMVVATCITLSTLYDIVKHLKRIADALEKRNRDH